MPLRGRANQTVADGKLHMVSAGSTVSCAVNPLESGVRIPLRSACSFCPDEGARAQHMYTEHIHALPRFSEDTGNFFRNLYVRAAHGYRTLGRSFAGGGKGEIWQSTFIFYVLAGATKSSIFVERRRKMHTPATQYVRSGVATISPETRTLHCEPAAAGRQSSFGGPV